MQTKNLRAIQKMSCEIRHMVKCQIDELKNYQKQNDKMIYQDNDKCKLLNLYENLLVVDPIYQFMVINYGKLEKQVSQQASDCRLGTSGNVNQIVLKTIKQETNLCLNTVKKCKQDAARTLEWIGGCKPQKDIAINSHKQCRAFILRYWEQICKINKKIMDVLDFINRLDNELNEQKQQVNEKKLEVGKQKEQNKEQKMQLLIQK